MSRDANKKSKTRRNSTKQLGSDPVVIPTAHGPIRIAGEHPRGKSRVAITIPPGLEFQVEDAKHPPLMPSESGAVVVQPPPVAGS